MSAVELGSGPITVGRASPEHAPDVPLGPDPQRWVGRLHCTLDFADGMWSVTDNASVNGTLLRHGDVVERLQRRKRIQHGDRLLILGDMTPEGEPLYWELTFLDPHTTQPAPFGSPTEVRHTGPGLRYDWVAARAYRVENGVETAISGLRPQGHQLLRYMAGRGSGGAAVACDHASLITALWGPREEWPPHRSYTRADLAGVVRAVRRCIEADPSQPRILETVTGIGYRLNVSGPPT
ncbi:FHA domain-containing protein [Nonomuraea terrae]|uniref:FHA domain-containing protein n=1 Tax=Nonomuraea terrae TaxID=2530383 RepID=A0A4R4Z7H4_9ACTN|nr:FHA domain-containing protein [Nonomuraea terrae]TDD54113.1 FHA domain-containing protein [Nonomuraea terrae]